jgi:hypothetical protein
VKIIAIARIVVCLASLPSVARAMEVRVVSPLVQVFPSTVPAGETVARVEAARGEHEPFQIVVHAGASRLSVVRATTTPLDGGRIVPRLYRVAYLPVTTPSSVEGHPGPWPDALVPDVDALVGEPRRAFPFDVPAHEARAIWVELYVPPDATPGRHRGALTVTSDGQAAVTVPLELTVHDFMLPRTSSLPVTFGFATSEMAAGHPGLDGPELFALARRYAILALRHRISIHGGTNEPPAWHVRAGQLSVDFTAYDAEVGPFLDGTVDRGGPAEGARWSAFEVRIPQKLDGAARAEYTRQLVAHLKQKGWLARAFDYTFDEPNDTQIDAVKHRAMMLYSVAPEVPRLVTHALDERLRGAVDIWCPVVNFVDDKPGNSRLPPRAAYEGERLWWYQSCMSHGCNIVGGDYFTGWPSNVVDAPAMAHRILPWLTFRYRVQGELYFDTVAAYGGGKDPWRDQQRFGGNGDGTLFYPGRVAIIGGKHDIPIESIRLQLIREGLEDYEYLRLYERAAGPRAAAALARSIAGKTYAWQHDGALLLAARRRMAQAIDLWWRAQLASGSDPGITAR